MHVFHGPVEISGQVYAYAKAIRECGHRATAAVFEPHQYGYPYDELIYPNGKPNRWSGRVRRTVYIARALRRFDVFNYWFGRTILGDVDLLSASALGKPVVMTFCGSEIRSVSDAAELSPYMDEEAWPRSGPDVDRLEWLNDRVDAAVVRYHELQPYVDAHFDRVEYVPRAVDCDRVRPADGGTSIGPVRVAHAPSDRKIKGTRHVERAVSELRREGMDVELATVQGDHDDVIAELQRADVVVDQLQLGTFGNVALEAMATETPAVCYVRDDLRDQYHDSLPIVDATPDSITAVLRDLLEDPTRRGRLGARGREYVSSHHDLPVVGRRLVDLYGDLS